MDIEIISDIHQIPQPKSFRIGLVFGVGFSLFLVSVITAKNMFTYFTTNPANLNDFLLLMFSAWGIFYAVYLSISFLLVVIKRLPGCLWTAYYHGILNGKIHVCVDSVLNARLDITQGQSGISTKLLRSESARVWIVGLILLTGLVYFLITDIFHLSIKLIIVGLFSLLYFIYHITIHSFSIERKDLRGEGDYPNLLEDFLQRLRKRLSFKESL